METKKFLPLTKEEIASRLKVARKDAGLSQAEVSATTGVKQQTLSQWELGAIPDALPEFTKVVLALSHTPDALLMESDASAAELAKQRESANPETIENLMRLTQIIVAHDNMAAKVPGGELPSKILLEQAENVNRWLNALPAPASEESSDLRRLEEAEEALLELVEHGSVLPAGSKAMRAVELAVTELNHQVEALKSSEPKVSAQKASDVSGQSKAGGKPTLRLLGGRKK